MTENKRVYCLYRVSTLGQVDKDDIPMQKSLIDDADKAAKDIKEQYDRILTWADMFEGSTLEGKKMIMWQFIDKVRIYRDYQFEVDLKPTVKEFKALWSNRSTQSTNGAA